MKITLTGYETADSHGSTIRRIGESLYHRGWLKKIICTTCKAQIDIDQSLIIRQPAWLCSLNSLLSMSWLYLSRRIPERYYNERLFDLFSQRHISSDSDVLLCRASGLVRTVRKAKRNGILTIVHHMTLHPEVIYELLEEESRKFRVREESVFTHKKWNETRLTTLRECDAILVASNLVKQSCIQKGIPEGKIKVISTGIGVDVEYFNPSKSKREGDKFVCLFVGHKSLINGVPYLLEAWRKLNLKGGKLIVCGVQNRRIIERYSRSVDFDAPGPVANPLAYYQRASIFVLPSLAQAFARAALEAMSCGLPVVVTEGVGAKEIIKEGREGFILPIRDVDSLAEKIQYFYDNPDEVRRMGENARKEAEGHSWERYGDDVIERIEEVTG